MRATAHYHSLLLDVNVRTEAGDDLRLRFIGHPSDPTLCYVVLAIFETYMLFNNAYTRTFTCVSRSRVVQRMISGEGDLPDSLPKHDLDYLVGKNYPDGVPYLFMTPKAAPDVDP